MASSILADYLNNRVLDLRTVVRAAAQQKVLERLVAEQAASDAPALIAELGDMIVSAQERLTAAAERVAVATAALDNAERAVLTADARRQVAYYEKVRAAISDADLAYVAAEKVRNLARAELHTASNARGEIEHRIGKLAKAQEELQPLLV